MTDDDDDDGYDELASHVWWALFMLAFLTFVVVLVLALNS